MRDEDKARDNYAWKTSYDDAMRLWSKLRMHQLALSKDELLSRRYMAFRLADGESDGVAYDTREDAIRHQPGDQSRYGYLQIPLERLSNRACDSLLWYMRRCYDAGYRPAGAHEGGELILPMREEHLR